jgi:hypothetical protein
MNSVFLILVLFVTNEPSELKHVEETLAENVTTYLTECVESGLQKVEAVIDSKMSDEDCSAKVNFIWVSLIVKDDDDVQEIMAKLNTLLMKSPDSTTTLILGRGIPSSEMEYQCPVEEQTVMIGQEKV